ncbi:MAG: hypothetical protein UU24_C0021G0005 [Candidatus Nomurabacteria bacterium GW2011_GWA2_40_9]|uniref:Uncharacterized protein n=1 Tax=Candidatus Nomurabacteria bacterium GW2011_GWA2_40_9 TaxID=1618734 RepID=A0A0G0TVU4_9BACT|nr:MAG: hypothetical protein UU24_C0021G0005 [Candidatus Nomurabacteria bacterium GW2011_GWA2_40_9]
MDNLNKKDKNHKKGGVERTYENYNKPLELFFDDMVKAEEFKIKVERQGGLARITPVTSIDKPTKYIVTFGSKTATFGNSNDDANE